MNRRWRYPFYVIAVVLLAMLLFGCDGQGAALLLGVIGGVK